MEHSLTLQVSVAVTVIAVLAAASDLRTRRIPNMLVLAGLSVGMILNIWVAGWSGLGVSLAGLGVGLLLMLPGYLLRFTGGGDVKLVGAIGSLVGPKTLIYAFVLSTIAAAAIVVVQSIYVWSRRGAVSPLARYSAMFAALVATKRPVYFRPTSDEALGHRVPLAPAIALGTLGATWLPW